MDGGGSDNWFGVRFIGTMCRQGASQTRFNGEGIQANSTACACLPAFYRCQPLFAASS